MLDSSSGNAPDTHAAVDSAVLVSLDLNDSDSAENLEELRQLAASDRLAISAVVLGKRLRPDPATFAGSGKVDEIMGAVEQTGASLVIFNHDLSPAQQRNLEQRLRRRVIDRTSLILDIFAQRAKSHEGKLQVELAQLEHLATRLVRGWTHLERQKGGIGLRGPGETQLETDRRLLGKRVKVLKEKLAKFERQRALQRRARRRAQVMSVSLVGYTNAGKSTLFNRLTRGHTYVADQLFATLDATTRKLFIADRGPLVLSDTVGFIRDLPHTLVAAFRATLEETVQADLLLHVVDTSSSNRSEQIDEVNKVLKEIGADRIPQILVLNKTDLVDLPASSPGYQRDEYGRIVQVRLSAKTGEGLEFINLALSEALGERAALREPDNQSEAQDITSGYH
ncbi:GTP-binding protein HflX [Nitrosospira multiformis ATCC 25196]|uniref:GTPase HflX n=1 Tax=Nitrosospira multiformis (strain ATCC 25196 / NCIMB 11849 / C 71) TaxID=323848 RepID=Q2YBW7_NITMU|nr:GTPase HflX [Nitrosospira multiformis]ABB73754.1 GTP-binding protein HflX [Nitrosospira multiformis ATCC 25196]SEF41127.1 GTP-binding protein HflX [Nitrosospira multiformis ATCC 25196]